MAISERVQVVEAGVGVEDDEGLPLLLELEVLSPFLGSLLVSLLVSFLLSVFASDLESLELFASPF
jgi:hypothetical protein